MFLAVFISACSTTPKDTAASSGSGSSGEFNTASTASEEKVASTAIDTTTSDFSGIISGSYEDLIVNVGDRVYFSYDSFVDIYTYFKVLNQHKAFLLVLLQHH